MPSQLISDKSYDYDSAIAAGLGPDKTGHWPSRVPSGSSRGLILKSEDHPTFQKTIEGEKAAGYTLYRHKLTGRLFSFPKAEMPGKDFVPLHSSSPP